MIPPPIVVISTGEKPTGASENVKVMVAVWPAFSEAVLLVMVSVGARVSNEIEGALAPPPRVPKRSV
ncbi:MAG: hypothetical protein ACK559_41260 [bacterium]